MDPSSLPEPDAVSAFLDPTSVTDLMPGWVDGFFEIRADGSGILSEDARRMLGWTGASSALPWRARIHPADVPGAERAMQRLQSGDVERLSFECRLRSGDGGWTAVLLCGKREGASIKGFLIDLSRLPVSQIRFRQTLELLDDFVSLHVDDFRPNYVTPALTRLTGITPEAAAGEADMSWVHPDDRRHVMQVRAQIRRGGDATLRWRLRCADGGWRWLETRCRKMEDPSWRPARFLCTSRDVHDGVEAATRAQWQARHDPLTDLPNRNFFLERVSQSLSRLRPGRLLGLLFIDLDGFKQINDTLGHAVGDALLRAVASRLQEQVRGGDVVARMGGDEFTVLLTRLASAEEAVVIARRLLLTLAKPFSIGDRDLFVTAS
ncbi:MAG: diguanylate cyclase domain-containing protein, partial [Armatimonadota bacterium]